VGIRLGGGIATYATRKCCAAWRCPSHSWALGAVAAAQVIDTPGQPAGLHRERAVRFVEAFQRLWHYPRAMRRARSLVCGGNLRDLTSTELLVATYTPTDCSPVGPIGRIDAGALRRALSPPSPESVEAGRRAREDNAPAAVAADDGANRSRAVFHTLARLTSSTSCQIWCDFRELSIGIAGRFFASGR
jgi:hypothetical protein